MRLRLRCAITLLCLLPAASLERTAVTASDLDDFMARVLARRDENWKKLQQYLLDERQRADVLGPGGARLYGFTREYTWYVREGYFVRSPVRFDGVTLSDAERRGYEARWLEQEKARERKAAEKSRGATQASATSAGAGVAATTGSDQRPGAAPGGSPPATAEGEVGDLLSQTQEPQFVSAAYFLKFKFEPGHYVFAGRDTFEGKNVLRIEYYPERLFNDEDDERRPEKGTRREHSDREEQMTRQMNKVAMVTLWVEPTAHQVVQYRFDNVGFDFLPGKWLVRVSDVRASMRMGEVFPDVWLPRHIEARVALTLASGTYELQYDHEFADYRRAEVEVKVR